MLKDEIDHKDGINTYWLILNNDKIFQIYTHS
jgi:hypothetical protein